MIQLFSVTSFQINCGLVRALWTFVSFSAEWQMLREGGGRPNGQASSYDFQPSFLLCGPQRRAQSGKPLQPQFISPCRGYEAYF